MKIDSGKNDDLFIQFLLIGTVGGSLDNYRATWKVLKTTSVFVRALFMESFLLINLFSVSTARSSLTCK